MLENKDLLIAGLIVLAVSFIYQYVYYKLKQAYDKRDSLNEKLLGIWEHDFNSLLHDKKIEAKRRKDAESKARQLVEEHKAKLDELKTTHYDIMDRTAENPLNKARAVIELLSRIGIVNDDVWSKHNRKNYTSIVAAELESVAIQIIPATRRMAEATNQPYNDEMARKTTRMIREVSKTIMDGTSIIDNLVHEMTTALETYYKDREVYLTSGGPEPLLRVDPAILNGSTLKPMINDIVSKYDIDTETRAMIEKNLVDFLLYPIHCLSEAVNYGHVEVILYVSGCVVLDFNSRGHKLNFVLPCMGRLEIERNFKVDTSKYLK